MPAARESKDVLASIEAGDLAPVYALVGEETHPIERCLEALKKAVVGDAAAREGSFNLDTFDLKQSGVSAALDSARTMPMFAKRRLVIGRGLGELKADDLVPLLAYIDDPNPTTCLVLVGPGKIDGRLKVFQALKKAGFLHDFQRLRDWQLAQWVEAEARRRGLAIVPDAARALADAAGPELGRLSVCLDQVALYAGEGVKLTAAHVEAVIPGSRERGIFELTKAIGAGQKTQAMALLANLLSHREPPLRIQFMLVRQFRQIWRAKELDAAGVSRPEIAGQVGMSPHFLDDVLIPARRMSATALRRSFTLLYEADKRLKSSRVDPEIQISKLVLALTQEAAGTSDQRRPGGPATRGAPGPYTA
ncbi:MAG TPA: DNA polymerase III subunit delta [Polyangia bacterium]